MSQEDDSGFEQLMGRLYRVGGPKGNPPRTVPGTVTIHGPGGEHETTAGEDGYYAVHLPAGTYTVTATSPKYIIDGLARPAHAEAIVEPGRTTTADVNFSMK